LGLPFPVNLVQHFIEIFFLRNTAREDPDIFDGRYALGLR